MSKPHSCPINEYDVLLCNCAGCKIPMLGDSMREKIIPKKYRTYQFVGGRILGRPYCESCLAIPDVATGQVDPPDFESEWKLKEDGQLEECA